MARWLTSDHRMLADLMRRIPPGDTAELCSADALASALESESASVAVLPAAHCDTALVVTIQRPERKPAMARAAHVGDEPVAYRAGGFLGLADEPVFEEEEPAPPRKWWKKIL